MGNESRTAAIELLQMQDELERRRRFNKIKTYYRDTGPVRRELYEKHIACFAAGAKYNVRAVMGANRCGKTEGIGCYETVLHMTGRYPSWWTGRRFKKPIVGLTVAREPKILRRGVQRKLFGGTKFGEALYPLECLDRDSIRTMPNGNGAYEFAPIKHESGGWSEHLFGTYKQGREAFESIELDWFHEDEEAPEDIHDEIVMRMMTTDGCGILTYTPLKGLTPLTGRIWTHKDDENPDVHVTNITWDDVPHLSEEQKADFLRKTPGYLRDARSKGIPASGVGRIYPVDPKDYTVKPFPAPITGRAYSAPTLDSTAPLSFGARTIATTTSSTSTPNTTDARLSRQSTPQPSRVAGFGFPALVMPQEPRRSMARSSSSCTATTACA